VFWHHYKHTPDSYQCLQYIFSLLADKKQISQGTNIADYNRLVAKMPRFVISAVCIIKEHVTPEV